MECPHNKGPCRQPYLSWVMKTFEKLLRKNSRAVVNVSTENLTDFTANSINCILEYPLFKRVLAK